VIFRIIICRCFFKTNTRASQHVHCRSNVCGWDAYCSVVGRWVYIVESAKSRGTFIRAECDAEWRQLVSVWFGEFWQRCILLPREGFT